MYSTKPHGFSFLIGKLWVLNNNKNTYINIYLKGTTIPMLVCQEIWTFALCSNCTHTHIQEIKLKATSRLRVWLNVKSLNVLKPRIFHTKPVEFVPHHLFVVHYNVTVMLSSFFYSVQTGRWTNNILMKGVYRVTSYTYCAYSILYIPSPQALLMIFVYQNNLSNRKRKYFNYCDYPNQY